MHKLPSWKFPKHHRVDLLHFLFFWFVYHSDWKFKLHVMLGRDVCLIDRTIELCTVLCWELCNVIGFLTMYLLRSRHFPIVDWIGVLCGLPRWDVLFTNWRIIIRNMLELLLGLLFDDGSERLHELLSWILSIINRLIQLQQLCCRDVFILFSSPNVVIVHTLYQWQVQCERRWSLHRLQRGHVPTKHSFNQLHELSCSRDLLELWSIWMLQLCIGILLVHFGSHRLLKLQCGDFRTRHRLNKL
jgi:hypothetical protein